MTTDKADSLSHIMGTHNGSYAVTVTQPCRTTGGRLGNHSDSTLQMLVIYAIALIVTNVLLNGLTFLTVLCLNKRRLRPNHVLLVGLSSSGWVLALFYLPCILVLLLWGPGTDCRLLCRALTALERGLIAVSTWGIAVMSVDRYMFIVRHGTYRTSMTVRRSGVVAGGVWCIGAVFGATSLLVSAHTTTASGSCLCHLTLDFYGIYHLLYSASYITFAFIIPTILILVFYGFIIRVAAKRVSNSRDKNPFRLTHSREAGFTCSASQEPREGFPNKASSPNQRAHHIRLYEIKTIRVICMAILCYLTCVTPYFVINVVVSTGHWTLPAFPQNIYLTSILILHTNSSCNPLLYGFTNRRLRAVLLGFIRKKLSCRSRSAERAKHKASNHLSVMPNGCFKGRPDSPDSEPSSFSTNSRETIVNCDTLDAANRYAIDPEDDKAFQSQTTELCSKESYAIAPCGACRHDALTDSASPDYCRIPTSHNGLKSGTSSRLRRLGRHGSDPIRNPLLKKNKKGSFGLSSIAETETLLTVSEEEGVQNGIISNVDPANIDRPYNGDTLFPESICNGEAIVIEHSQNGEYTWRELSGHSERLLRPRSPSSSWESH